MNQSSVQNYKYKKLEIGPPDPRRKFHLRVLDLH